MCLQVEEALQAASWQALTRWDELVGFQPLSDELWCSLHQEVGALRSAWEAAAE